MNPYRKSLYFSFSRHYVALLCSFPLLPLLRQIHIVAAAAASFVTFACYNGEFSSVDGQDWNKLLHLNDFPRSNTRAEL